MTGRLLLTAMLALLISASVAAEKRSGYEDASAETRAIQDDDAANPGFLWIQQGETLWSQRSGQAQHSCADCHGAASVAMRGVAAHYPVIDASLGRPITLSQRIAQCRMEWQGVKAEPADSDALLSLSAYVGLQSRGLPMQVTVDGAARPFFEAGRDFFNARQGQFNLSCSQCHDGLAGQRLGGSVIPQGHTNGYPEYRLEWQNMGALERRIGNCLSGVRAEPLAPNDPTLAALELYLGWRDNGLRVETPAVRP
jgi:sulfur-oxidizing protein SoxA